MSERADGVSVGASTSVCCGEADSPWRSKGWMQPISINTPVKLNINQCHFDPQNIPRDTAVALLLENLSGGQTYINSRLWGNSDWPLKKKMRHPFKHNGNRASAGAVWLYRTDEVKLGKTLCAGGWLGSAIIGLISKALTSGDWFAVKYKHMHHTGLMITRKGLKK